MTIWSWCATSGWNRIASTTCCRFLGVAHVAYLPQNRVVGISKLARVIDIFAKRLQTQETMTAQIAEAIENALKPRGVAILIDALHQCMTTRGVHKSERLDHHHALHRRLRRERRLPRPLHDDDPGPAHPMRLRGVMPHR